MPARVVIDARDGAASQLRGWGRYVRELVRALLEHPDPSLEIVALDRGLSGPEVVFEQVGLPVALLRRRASLVHAPNCFLPIVRHCPGVVTIHDLAFEAWPADFTRATGVKYRLLARAAARSAERIIVPSEFTAEDLIRRYGIPADRVRITPEAPALPIGDADVPPGRYLLAVGDLRAKKNLGELVAAFADLHEAGTREHRLILAGLDTGAGPELRGLARGAPVELTGYLGDAALDALIRGAELLVHPSLYEGFGLVILEAMARGTPVLAARAGALPQTGGEAAAYFAPGATPRKEALTGILRELLADEARRAELAARGRRHAEGFTWERTAALTAAVYRELIR